MPCSEYLKQRALELSKRGLTTPAIVDAIACVFPQYNLRALSFSRNYLSTARGPHIIREFREEIGNRTK